MNYSSQNSNNCVHPSRSKTVVLLIWMLGVMLFGWFLLDGPGVSSVVKRVAPLKQSQQFLRHVLGEPVKSASCDGKSKP